MGISSIQGKMVEIIAWVWVKRHGDEEMAEEGRVEIDIMKGRLGDAHVVSLKFVEDEMPSGDTSVAASSTS